MRNYIGSGFADVFVAAAGSFCSLHGVECRPGCTSHSEGILVPGSGVFPRPSCCAGPVQSQLAVHACRRDAATGEVRIGIFTTRAVTDFDELTYDYMFEHSGVGALARGFKCMCGARNCRCVCQ